MYNEGEEEFNENNEISEFDDFNNFEASENNNPCTLVYTEDFQLVCAESLVDNYVNNENSFEENKENIEYVESDQEVKSEKNDESLTKDGNSSEISETENESDPVLELLTSWNERYDSDFTSIIEHNENVESLMNDIYSYLDLFIGIWFIAWIFSQCNQWRRNNK